MSYTIVTNQAEVMTILQNYTFHHELNRFRDYDKQQEAMRRAMGCNHGLMALALHDEAVVGYCIMLDPESDERWSQLDYLKMLGVIEVAPPFRNQRLGKNLLQALFKQVETEKHIVISLECCWHWDLTMTNGDPVQYMSMLKHVLKSVGFVEYQTSEPDISRYDVNFMMARVGREISVSQVSAFTSLAKEKRYLW